MLRWALPDEYLQRVAMVSDSGFAYRLRSDETVFDDVDEDVLTGSAGDDWFFYDENEDRATDLKDEVFAGDLEWILS
jgi:hypothetical protein